MQGIITFRSITPAQRGGNLLNRRRIPCDLRRTPAELEERGCGYALFLQEEWLNPAETVLKENRIPYGRIYRKEGSQWILM